MPPRSICRKAAAGVIFDMACEHNVAWTASRIECAGDAKAYQLARTLFEQLQSAKFGASGTTGGAKDRMRCFGYGDAFGFREHPGNDTDRFHSPKGTLPVFPFFMLRYRDNAQSGK